MFETMGDSLLYPRIFLLQELRGTSLLAKLTFAYAYAVKRQISFFFLLVLPD